MNDWQQRVLALSGMALSAAAVQQIARSGQVLHDTVTDTLVNSVLNLQPDSTLDVYGSVEAIRPGLKTLIQQMGNSQQKDLELTRYMVGMIHLSRRLLAKDESMNQLAKRLEQVNRQYNEFGFERYRILQSLAGIYRELISPLGQPIRINGNPTYLKTDANQYHIRALLLAGVRSAVLWQQVGGKRRHFLLSRKRMLETAQQLSRAV
ncbi:high frequency lysogenization protein HflD [Idiomarina seosinensis]|uniref:High frequency lysogenization protein HflD homolog n=1 Tax=Idiomarina seosinensis TaxID=281739 RepID=A0A432ZHZ4_9GAMM|nr:high frequency lysogenization protein HflD [Idiomarina seosinensis]RUO77591.1 lysogenization regulator HflD [Idiomarina seosinensis]